MAVLDAARLNETFNLLTHSHRRYVLYYLTRESERADIKTLASAIAKWDGEHRETDRSTDRKVIETALYHTHLPKLADAGIISFGTNTDSIRLRETDGVDRFLADTARIDGYSQTAISD